MVYIHCAIHKLNLVANVAVDEIIAMQTFFESVNKLLYFMVIVSKDGSIFIFTKEGAFNFGNIKHI